MRPASRPKTSLLLFAAILSLAVPGQSGFAQMGAPKVWRVALCHVGLDHEPPGLDTLHHALNDMGYIDGRNLRFDWRNQRDADTAAATIREWIAERVDVIVGFEDQCVRAASQATRKIPIVFVHIYDPVVGGYVNSLARPGGNITGSVQFSPETGAKRLEFLREAFPRITRIAVFINPANAGNPLQLQTMRVTANALNLELRALEVRNAKELGEALAAMAPLHLEAIVVPTDTLLRAHATEIADRAANLRLPSAGSREYAEAGGLIGYGPDPVPLYRRSAYFVDRTLKGAKPDDLPIERATKVDLIINLKTAKVLGITIPQSLLVRADDVIR
jgi:ABC-type uncharacterized transport system substrate-binding protein